MRSNLCLCRRNLWLVLVLAPLVVSVLGSRLSAVRGAEATQLDVAYRSDIKPLLKQFCHQCHSGDKTEAEIDLAVFSDFNQVRRHPQVWQKISEMLSSEQMPPPDELQPTADERAKMLKWTRDYLMMEAASHAGDPGAVVLRRLSNVEYTYTLQDLTGLAGLNVAKEFPVDSAAGEGFTNVGNSLVMSPSLLTKYLDAAKEVSAHAVLLPNGLRFSASKTRQDWTNEILDEIRGIYDRYTSDGGDAGGNVPVRKGDTDRNGRLPLERYLLATVEERDALSGDRKTIEAVAGARGLSPKYLGMLWTMLQDSNAQSRLLDPLRAQWKTATAADVPQLTGLVAKGQDFLFKFNSVGQIGLHKNIHSWLVPVNRLEFRQEFRVKVPSDATGELELSLQSDDAEDGNVGDYVLWDRPRFVAAGRPELLLKDVSRVADSLVASRDRHFSQAAQCLAAAHEVGQMDASVAVEPLAKKYGVDSDSLAVWFAYLGVGKSDPVALGTPITRKQDETADIKAVTGWVGDDSLAVLANASDKEVRIPGTMPPHSVAVHPAPTLAVTVGWRSPLAIAVKISGSVQQANPECGNGTVWSLVLRRGETRQQILASGKPKRGEIDSVGPIDAVTVQVGDVIGLVVDAGGGNNSCDLTTVDLTLSDGTREWNLWKDVSPEILAGNPHADSHGNADVWHFSSELASGGGRSTIPEGSVLTQWLAARDPAEKQRLAHEFQRILQLDPATLAKDSADAALSRQLRSLANPFMAAVLHYALSQDSNPTSVAESKWDPPLRRFSKCPDARTSEPTCLDMHAPGSVKVRVPADLVAGSEFVVTGRLHPETGQEGSVRLKVESSLDGENVPSSPASIVVMEGSQTARRIEAEFHEFRNLFPPTLSYSRIVPVDEVVTLILYHREDDQLRRLMSTPAESAQLDRLWDELFYVSHEPLKILDAFAQLNEYATQDRHDLLPAFDRMRQPVRDRADAFRKRLVDTEHRHVDAVIDFAGRAYRRPLGDEEKNQLRSLYANLRQQDISHDEAVRLTLSRVLAAPAFLYKVEKPDAGTMAAPVSDFESANRLSYFLWSTAPDVELRDLAQSGKLRDPNVLAAQARRMLGDPKIRRMATEFGCHWLHIHDFENHNEKSERHFPTFAALRGAMYEESILVLTDLLQNNRSVLSLVDGDATFLNEPLAQHYGIPGVVGPEWRRVEGVRQYSRGSILSWATTMAKQSGASRTSPILRGNWLSEVVLGEKLPRPPKNVPVLADTVPEGLTERQLIARHTTDSACAKCHLRIDPFGFALEGFDAIGRLRSQDAAGLTIDTKTVLFDGTAIDGFADLKEYLGATRRDAFVRQFQRKLLGYALGRSVQLSDEPLLNEMQQQLIRNDYRVGLAIEAIVRSPQFREIRGRDVATTE